MAFDDTFEDLPEEDFDTDSSDQQELEEYGVWVTGEPEDLDETEAESAASDTDGIEDIDFSDSDELELDDDIEDIDFDSAISEEEETLLQDIASEKQTSVQSQQDDDTPHGDLDLDDDLAFSIDDLENPDEEIQLETSTDKSEYQANPEQDSFAENNQPEAAETEAMNDDFQLDDIPEIGSGESASDETSSSDDTTEISLDDFFDDDNDTPSIQNSYADEDDDEEDEFLDIDIDFDEDPYELPPEIETQKPQNAVQSETNSANAVGEEIDLDDFFSSDDELETAGAETSTPQAFNDAEEVSLDEFTSETESEGSEPAEEPEAAGAQEAPEPLEASEVEEESAPVEVSDESVQTESDEYTDEEAAEPDFSVDDLDIEVTEEPYVNPPVEEQDVDYLVTEEDGDGQEDDATPGELAHATPPAQPQTPSPEAFSGIERELHSIREELAALKTELSELRAPAAAAAAPQTEPPQAETAPEPEADSDTNTAPTDHLPETDSSEASYEESYESEEDTTDSQGFFEDDEDDTIALTGDELDNILNTAEFTQQTGTPAEPEFDIHMDEDSEQESDSEEQTTEDEEIIEIPTEGGLEHADEPADSDKNVVEPEDDEDVFASFEDDFTADDEPEEPIEEISLESTEEAAAEETSQEESGDDSFDTGFSEGVDEAVASMASLDIDDELEDIDSYKAEYDDDDISEDLDELEIDEPETAESPVADAEAIPGPEHGDEDLEDSESDAAFNEHLEEPEDILEPDHPVEARTTEPEPTRQEAAAVDTENQEAVQTETDTQAAKDDSAEEQLPSGLKEEIRSILSYMDQLLESLPEEKIQEFARSEHFVVYKRLFDELGL